MKNLLFVFFIFGGMIAFFTHAMVLASRVNAGFFWLAILALIVAMVVIGCWSLSEQLTNQLGWIFMIVISAFCILTSLSSLGESWGLIKVAFFGIYGAVGVRALVREKDSGHAQ